MTKKKKLKKKKLDEALSIRDGAIGCIWSLYKLQLLTFHQLESMIDAACSACVITSNKIHEEE
jgi:hypothetical protein